MQRIYKQRLKKYIISIAWIFVIQIILANISAAIYAYKFTHFYTNPPPYNSKQNIFLKTWKLFVGPRIYKLTPDTITPAGYAQIKLQTSNGLLIDGWYGAADSARGCIIFFHGITNNKAVLLKEAIEFQKWGYNVLLIDFRAHGNSEGNKSSFGLKKLMKPNKLFNMPMNAETKISSFMEVHWVQRLS